MSQQRSNLPPEANVQLSVVHVDRAYYNNQVNVGYGTQQFVEKRLGGVLAKLFAADMVVLTAGIVLMNALLSVFSPDNSQQLNVLFPANILAFIGLAAVCRFYQLHESRYIIGQATLMALGLLLVNGVTFFTLGINPLVQLLAMGVMGASLIPMVMLHHYLGFSYSMADSQSLFYRIELKLKRLADFIGALCGLIALSPLFIMTAILIRLDSPGGVIYSQTRVGLNEEFFRLYKFRSMSVGERRKARRNHNEKALFKMKNDPRVTAIGKILRKLSIDELPQLINVLKGEMSIVGPRPPIVSEFEEMELTHRLKFQVIPGMTGLWQVTGRVHNERSFDQVAEYDVAYINDWSLFNDIAIILRTVPVVLFQRGAC